ncbi:MAG: hypothetical protein SGJ05_01185 [bacterium]|nr:hypothetical protein [bacterium]
MKRFSSRYILAVVVVSMSVVCIANAQVTTSNKHNAYPAFSAKSLLNAMPAVSSKQSIVGPQAELRESKMPLVPMAARAPKLVEMTQDNGVGVQVGTTYYDFQTNACMPNRVTYFEDGGDRFIQLLWMAASDSTRDATSRVPGFNPSRGSHYNFVDVSDPENLPDAGIAAWKKIEAERAGWPSAVQFDDGTLATPSHTPVRFYRNGGLTDDNFQKTATDPTTAADSALWPRAAIDGANNVHLIYNRTFPGSPNSLDQVCYRRSTSAGDTWEPELKFTGAEQLPGAANAFNGHGGDTYAITARGNWVSVALYSNFSLVLWHSSNGGSTWTRRSFPTFQANTTPVDTIMNADGTQDIQTDTAMGPLNSMDLIIDANGVTHFVVAYCPQYLIGHIDAAGSPTASTIYIMNGNSHDQQDLLNTGLAYGNTADTSFVYFMGRVGGGSWDGEGFVINHRIYDGGSRWPQLGMDASNNLYCLYGSMKSGDLKTVTVDTTNTYVNGETDTLVTLEGLQMHVYGTQLYAGTTLWSAPKDLSQMGANSQYASLCDQVVNDHMYYAYSASATPGDRVTNTEMASELTSIYARSLATSVLNAPSDVPEESVLKADVALAPNPSDESTRILISGVTNGALLVSLASSLGEIVMQTSAQPFGDRAEILIPTRGLASGAYMVTIQQNGRRITKTLSVIH